MAQVIDTNITDIVSKFLERLNEEPFHIDAVYLYGSCAKGKQHAWSDIDIAIISPDFPEDNFDEMVRLSVIASRIDSRIEPVLFRPDDFIDENPLVWEIKKESIPLEVQNGIKPLTQTKHGVQPLPSGQEVGGTQKQSSTGRKSHEERI